MDINNELLEQIGKAASKGVFGAQAETTARRYAALDSLGVSAAIVSDFYSAALDSGTTRMRDYFCQTLLVVYREAKKEDTAVAEAYAHALVRDYPSITGSALSIRYKTLIEAGNSLRLVYGEKNPSHVWQQTSRHFLAYSEFLNGLLGYLIIAWRCHLGKVIKPNVLNNTYGSKVQQFGKLPDSELFSHFLWLARPPLRNAIAHGTVWLDSENEKVRFIDGRHEKKELELDLVEFMALVQIGSHLGSAYAAAMAAIVVFETARGTHWDRLPGKLLKLLLS